jgi:hypothetical protein
MMLTLDLKAQFEALATQDHVLRIQALLTELNAAQQYASHTDFPDVVRQWVDALDIRGIHGAYQQACVIFSAMAGNFRVESIPEGMDVQALLAHCVSKALRAGVPQGPFQHIHRVLSGVGVFNEAWVHPQAEPDCLNNLSASLTSFIAIDLPCLHEGLANSASLEAIHNQAALLRTVSGFQHKISAHFPLLCLLSRVCQGGLSHDPWSISLHPVFEHCELGMGAAHGFATVQKLRLVDVRKISLAYQKRHLELPDSSSQSLESIWKRSGLLREATLHLHAPVVQADLAFRAGWESRNGGFVYATQGEMRLGLSAGCIQWQGALMHEGCLVQLGISLPQDIRLDWSLASEFPVGQLPVGVPFLVRQQNLPLHLQLNSAICVGKPILNLTNPIVGHLSLRLVANIDPETHSFGLTLELAHSELICEWQAADALLGWTCGKWSLLAESPIHTWELNHG